MTNLNLKSIINVNDEQYLVEDLVNHLSKLPAEEVVSFFKNLQISVPRILRIRVLKNVLRDEVIFTRQRLATLADETNYRLSWFRKFAEYQLENYLEEFKKDELKVDFLQQLWTTLLNYLVERQVSFSDVLNLVEKSKGYEVLPFDMLHYNKVLNEIFYDDTNKIDGLTPSQFRPVLYKSSTIPQIREIGLKYNVNVPKRLKKQELLDIVFDVLKEREQYSEELELVLKKKNIIQIQRFCIDNEIKVSTELKKEEIIEYILRNAAETRQDYFLPTNHSAYEYEVTDFDVEEDEKEIVEKENEYLADQMAELESKSRQVEEVIEVEKPVDKTLLLNLFSLRNEQLNSGLYDEKTDLELKEKVELGQKALNSDDLSQEEIDKVCQYLQEQELVEKPLPVNKEELQNLLALRHADLESNLYTQETNEQLKDLISLGNKALEDDQISQEEVDNVSNTLRNVELVKDLKLDHLVNLISKKQELLTEPNTTVESKQNLNDLINHCLDRLQDKDLTQQEVDQLYEELLNTFVEKETVDKSKLQNLHDLRQKELEKDLEENSRKELENRLKVARLCLDDENATSQNVDEVYEHLKQLNLVEKSSLELANLLNELESKKALLKENNYTQNSYEEVKEAVEKIEKSLEEDQLSQSQVDHYERYLRSLELITLPTEQKQEELVETVEEKELVDKVLLAQLIATKEVELELNKEHSTKDSALRLENAIKVGELCLKDNQATDENVLEVYNHLYNTNLEILEAECCEGECVSEEVVEELSTESVEEVKVEEEPKVNEEHNPILEVRHLDFTTGNEKVIHIRKGKDLRPIYAPEYLEKDGDNYKFQYWTLLEDDEQRPFEFNQPLEKSITLIPVFEIVEEEQVIEPVEEVVVEEKPEVVEEVVVEEKAEVLEEEQNYYIHDYVTDLEELVKTQKEFVLETNEIESIYTPESYENFTNNLIASEQLLTENPDNALCRVQYNLLAQSRFNLVERQKEVVVEPIEILPVKEEVTVVEDVKPEEQVETGVEIVEDALLNDVVETTEVEQPEEVEVDLDVQPRNFYTVLDSQTEPVLEKEVHEVHERVVETTIKSAETVINNYYYQGTVNTNGIIPQGPVNYNIETPSFDNLKVNAASYDTSDRTKVVDYEQLTGEKLNDRPQDCDCLYTHKRDWLFVIFAFFVLIAIAITIALIVYRLIVQWN